MVLGFLLGAASIFALVCCSHREDPVDNSGTDQPPNVVVVCIDTLRADHTSCYDYSRPTTPHLQRIAERGLLLRHYYANGPWTKPSVASIITGLHPTAHGSRMGQFGQKRSEKRRIQAQVVETLSDNHQTLAETFQRAGYRTLAHVTNYNLVPKFGYSQGYDQYQFVENATGKQSVNRSDRAAITFARKALEDHEQPVFVWSHLMSVHQYVAPTEFEVFPPEGNTPLSERATQTRLKVYESVEHMVSAYDNAILYVDSLLGELFDDIVENHPNTILVVTSDHGEEFFEHGGFEHAGTLYNELLRIPCVLWGPGVPQGEIEGVCDSLDLYPTLTALAKLGPSVPELPGAALIGPDQRLAAGKGETFAEQHHRGPVQRYSIIREGRKLIWSTRKRTGDRSVELYRDGLGVERDLVASDAATPLVEDLKQRIEQFKRGGESYFRKNVGDGKLEALNERDVEALRALGYIE